MSLKFNKYSRGFSKPFFFILLSFLFVLFFYSNLFSDKLYFFEKFSLNNLLSLNSVASAATSKEEPSKLPKSFTSPTITSNKPHYEPGVLIIKLSDRTALTKKSGKTINFDEGVLDVADLRLSKNLENFKKKSGLKTISSLTNLSFTKIKDSDVSSKLEKAKLSNIYKLTFSTDAPVLDLITEISRYPEIEFAQPNFLYNVSGVPNDPNISSQWAHSKTNVFNAWDLNKGSKDTVIAVIDTGVDYKHPDLRDNIWLNVDEIPNNGIDDDLNGLIDDTVGYDFVQESPYPYYPANGEDGDKADNDPMDYNGHGTHVAGIVAAKGDNGIGISGVCPKCSIMPLKAGYTMYDGGGILWDSFIFESIIYAVINGADIINMSFGSMYYSALQEEALNFASSMGVTLVAAAGNDGASMDSSIVSYPAYFSNVISVASTNVFDADSSFTNSGVWINIAAPGGDYQRGILSTVPRTGYNTRGLDYAEYSGTSMASPYIAGAIGLLKSHFSNIPDNHIEQILMQSVDTISFSRFIGSGRINVEKMLNYVNNDLESGLTFDNSQDISKKLNITGFGYGGDFSSADLSIGSGFYPQNFETIKTINAPFGLDNSNDYLIESLDSKNLKDGYFTIRLKTIASNGSHKISSKVIKIQNLKFVGPLFNDTFGTYENIPLRILNYGGYESFEFSSSKGFFPNEWDSSLFLNKDYDKNDTTNVVEVANFMPNSLNSAAPYFFKINPNEYNNEKQVRVFIDNNLKLNWPLRSTVANYDLGGDTKFYYPKEILPIVDDINNDGKKEILTYGAFEDTSISVFDLNKKLLWSKPFYSIYNTPPMYSGAPFLTAQLDFTPQKEIILIDNFTPVDATKSQLRVLDYQGRELWQFLLPQFAPNVSAADLNNDGKDELILLPKGHQDDYSLIILTGQGQCLLKWKPKEKRNWVVNSYDFLHPVIGNFDKDLDLEVFFGKSFFNSKYEISTSLYVLNLDGSVVKGWPKIIDSRYVSSAASADLNNDGRDEIVYGKYSNHDGNKLKESVIIFNSDGTKFNSSKFPDNLLLRSPISIGDLNEDSVPEIVLVASDVLNFYSVPKLYVFDTSGKISNGWPLDLSYNKYFFSPLVADINSDGKNDVLVNSNDYNDLKASTILAFEYDGTPVKNFPKTFDTGIFNISVTDLEGDNKLDLIGYTHMGQNFETGDYKWNADLFVWNLDADITPTSLPWPSYCGNTSLTCRYDAKVNSPVRPKDILLNGSFESGLNQNQNTNMPMSWKLKGLTKTDGRFCNIGSSLDGVCVFNINSKKLSIEQSQKFSGKPGLSFELSGSVKANMLPSNALKARLTLVYIDGKTKVGDITFEGGTYDFNTKSLKIVADKAVKSTKVSISIDKNTGTSILDNFKLVVTEN